MLKDSTITIICNHNTHEAAFKYKMILPSYLSLILRNTSIRQNPEAKSPHHFSSGDFRGGWWCLENSLLRGGVGLPVIAGTHV